MLAFTVTVRGPQVELTMAGLGEGDHLAQCAAAAGHHLVADVDDEVPTPTLKREELKH